MEDIIKNITGNIKNDIPTTILGILFVLFGLGTYVAYLFLETKNPIDTNIIWGIVGIGAYCIVTRNFGKKDKTKENGNK